MKFVAIILISLTVATVMSNPMPGDDGLTEDLCHGGLRATVGNQCTGKNETIWYGCIIQKCHAIYDADKTNCEGIQDCIENSGC